MPDFDSLYNQLATNPSIKNGIVNPIFVDREVGVNPYATQADPLYAKYLDQSKLNQFGNALERGVVKFALSIPENAGYMFDMANSNKDFDNSVSAWARNLKEDVDREFPEYSKYFEDGFNPGSYNWWMRNGDSIVESIGYMVPGLLVGKTVGTFAKLMGAAANTARMAGAVGAAVASNYAEGMQMAGSRYREMLESGVSKEIAAEQASSIVNQNRWNILLQIPESYMLLRGLGGTRSFASLGFKNSMKDIGKQFVMEGFEEWNQGFIEEDNVREGKIRAGLLVDDGSTKLDRILKYGASDDALTQAFIGGIGGGAMQGGSDVLANLDPKYKEQKQKALAQIAANHGETVKMFEDLAKIQTAKENSVNDEVQFKHLARTQALEIALKNAKQGTFSQFLKTFDAVSNMSQEEAEQKGLTEAVKMAAEIRPALLKIEQKYGSLESKHSNISKDFIVDVAKQAFLADSHKKAADEYSEKIDTAYKTVRDVLTKQANKAQNSYIATQGVLAQFESLLKDNKDSEFFKYGVEEATKARDRAVKQVEEADNFGKLTDKDWKDKNTSLPMLDDDIKSDMELELINSIKADFHSKEYEKYADPKKIKTILEEQAKEEEIKVKNEEEAAYNEILKPVKTLIDKAKSTAVFEEGEKVKTKSELQASFDVLKNSKGFKQASKTTQTKLEQEYLSAIKAIDRAKDKTEIKSEEVKKDNRKARIAIIDKQIEKLKKLIKTQHLNKYKNRAKLAEVNESIKKLQDEKELLNSYIAATGNTSPEVREEVVIKSVIQEVEYSEVKTNEEYFNSFIKRFIKSLKVLDTNGLTELFETVKADLTKSIQQLNQIKYDSLNGIQTTKQEEDLVKMIIANNTAKLAAIEEEFVLREIVEENNETIILEENTQTGRTLIKQKEVEQAFKSVAVDDISEDGRVITIRGKKYYNQYSDGISGAINRNKNGDIVSISLSNEQGKTVTFTQSKLVDEIAFALLSTEVLIKRDISESVVIASEVEEQIDEFKIASERKTQSIKEKIEFLEKDLYELEQIIWYLDIALAQEYDMLVAEGIDTKESKELLRTSAQYSQRESAKEIVKIIKNKKEKLSEELKKPAIVKPLKNESTKITRKPAVESTETTSEQTNKGKNTFVKEIPFEERGVSVADLLYDIIKEEEEAKSKEKEIAETIIVPIIETIETTVTAEEEITFIPSDKDLQENAKEANPEFDGEVVTRKKDNIQTGGYQGRPYTKTTEGDQIFYEDIVDENGNPVINTPNDPRLNDYTFFKPKEELEIVIDEDEAKRLGIEIKEENLYKIPFGIRKPGSPITMWVHTFSAPPGIGIDQRIKDLIAEKEDLQKVEQDKLVSLRNFLWSKLQNGGVVPASVKDKTTGYALFTEARNTIDQVGIDGKVADDIEFLYVQDDLLKPIGESENRVNLQGRRDKSGKLMFPTGSTLIGVPSMTVDRLTGKNLLEPYFVQLQTLDKDAVDSVMAVITSNNPVTMISGAMPNLKFEEFLSYFFYTGKNSQNIYINVDTENGVKTRYIYTLGMGKGNWDQNSRIRVWTNDANNPIKPEELSQAKAFFETTYYSIDKKIKQYPVFKVNEGKLTVSETIGYKEHIANHSKTAIHGKRIIGTNRMQFFVQPVIGIAIPEFDNNTVVEKKETVAPKKKPLEGVVRHKETIADPIVKPVVPTEAKKADIERINKEREEKLKTTGKKQVEKHLEGIRQPFSEDLEPTQEEIEEEKTQHNSLETAAQNATINKIKKSGILNIVNSLNSLKETLRENPTLATKEILEEIEQLENKLKELNIEIANLRGKKYHIGMNVLVDRKQSSNENSKTGEEIITSVSRPQVNYKGEMVQSAKVTAIVNYDSNMDGKTVADKINAKYDAELAALESPQQSNEEAKKADIERRRQEELFGNITALEFETTDTKGRLRKTTIKTKVDENGFKYSFETTVEGKSSSTSAPKVSKDQIKNSSIYENLDQNSKDFIDELPDDAVIFLQSIAISTDKNSAAGLGNGNITIGYTSKSEGGRVDDILLKYQPNKINAKYDAELAALEGKKEVKEPPKQEGDFDAINPFAATIKSVIAGDVGQLQSGVDLINALGKTTPQALALKSVFVKYVKAGKPQGDFIKEVVNHLKNINALKGIDYNALNLANLKGLDAISKSKENVVTELLNTPDERFKEDMLKILSIVEDFDIEVVGGKSYGTMAIADSKNKKITVYANGATNTNRPLHQILGHEIVHLATVQALINPTNANELKFKQRLTEVYNKVKPKLKKQYATSNIKEFIAEFYSNEDFRNQLANIEENLATKIWNWIKELFGFKSEQMIDVIKETNEITNDFIKNFKGYNKEGNVSETNALYDNYKAHGISMARREQLLSSASAIILDRIQHNISKSALEEHVKGVLAEAYDNTGDQEIETILYETITDEVFFKEVFNEAMEQVVKLDIGIDERENWQVESRYEINPYMSTSKQTRRFLATIPILEKNVDGDIVYKLNEFGLKTYVNPIGLHTNLADTLANKNVMEYLAFLGGQNAQNYIYDPIKWYIHRSLVEFSKGDLEQQQIYQAFLTDFKKQKSTFVSLRRDEEYLFNEDGSPIDDGQGEQLKEWRFRIFQNNKMGQQNIIANWYNSFKFKMVRDEAIDTEKAKTLLTKYRKAREGQVDIPAIKEVLTEAGIDISIEALTLALSNPEQISKKYKADTFLDAIDTVLKSATKDGEGIVSLNNPFLNEETSLKLLARVEAQVNSTLFSSMFRNDEGKNIYAISNNTMLSYLDKDYQEKGVEFQHLTQDVYSKDSLLVKEIAEGIGYNIDIFSTATIEEASQFRGLSPNERTLVKITNFLNRGEDTARIQFPTIEAKPIVPILQVKRIRVDFDGKLDNNTLELAYNIVKSEFNRIKQVQEEQKTLEPKDLIMNYHYSLNKKGEVDFTLANGLKFHLIPEINDILDWKNIHAENLVDFKEEIKTWLNNHLNEKVEEEWLRLIELGVAYELGGKRKVKDEYKDKKSMNKLKLNDESLVRNYVVNYFVRHADVYQVFGGDMAYSKGHVDMTKRLAMLIAPGLNLDTKEGTFKVAVIPDVKQGSAMIPNWDKVLDYLNDKYKLKIDKKATLENLKGINSTDAQSWLNLDAKKDWTHRLGRLSTEINQMIDNSSVGIHTAPKGQTIGSDKIVYAGRYWDGKKNITTYIKTSTNTIIPDAQNEDFQDLSKKSDMITYPSAFKMGMRGMSEDASTPIELSYSGLMLQTEIPYHDETEITALSQARKMLMEGLLDPVYKGLDYKFYGQHLKVRDFRRLFHNLHIANVKEVWADLSHKLGIKVTAEDGKIDYEITDLAKVRDLLLSSGKLNDVEKEMLELENGQFNIPLFFSTANERFESILFSIVSNKIIALEQNGSSFVQASQIGYQNLTKEREKVKLFKDLTKEQLDKIEFLDEAWKEDILNANKGSLRDLYYEDNKIKPAQILVSNIYRKYVKNGKADIEALRKEGLLNMFLMRAPYQLASGFPAEIVGFLPEEMGDVIVVPHEAMVRIGFDFDVDKLFGYFHNTDKTLTKVKYLAKPEDADLRWNLYKDRVLAKQKAQELIKEFLPGYNMDEILNFSDEEKSNVEGIFAAFEGDTFAQILGILQEEDGVYTEEEFKALPIEQQNSKKARENAILDMFFEVYEKPEIMYKLLTSNSEEPLRKATERIERKLLTSGPLTISEQERLFDANKDGKIGIAISSLWVTMQEDLQYNDVRINTHDGENEVINAGIKFLNSKGNIYKEINDDSKHFKELVLVEEKLKLKNVDTPQYEGVGFHKIKTRGISNDLVSKFMLVIQTSTVDNAKNQTMTPANLNAHTLSTVLYMSSMGIDDFDLMVRFINQPVIRDYVKLRNQNIKQYDVNKQLFTKYGALVVKNGGKPVKKEKDATKIKAYSSKELLTMLDKVETADYYNDQLEILNKWIIYSEGAGTIFGAAVSANLDTKKLGKNYFEALSRYHDYEKTIKQSTFIGLDKIFEGTLAGSFIDYAVKPSIKMFNNPQLLPYGYRLYIKANNFYLDNIGTFNEKTHRAFNSEMLAFVASFDNGISDVSEREELLKLPKQILALKTKYPENLLLKMIDVELGIEKRKRFDAIRFRRTNLEPEQVKYASQSFQELLDNPETAPYAEKMIKYTLLFYGLSQNSSSLLPVIPYRYLVAKGFGKAYKSKAFVEAMNSDDTFELFKDQYAANNVKLLQHGGTAIEGKSIILKASQAKAEYLSFRTKKGTFAGKAVATNHDATEFQYVLINPLGNEEFYEYSFKPVESVFSKVKFAPVQAVFTAKPVIEVKESVKEVNQIPLNKIEREYTPENVISLKPNEIFVFGSNAEGVHGKGTALLAKQKFGAVQGQSEGLQGQSYAVITKKDWRVKKSSTLNDIFHGVEKMLQFAKENPSKKFLVTKIGSSLGGYTISEIKEVFYDVNNVEGIPDNVILPKEYEVRDAIPTISEVETVQNNPKDFTHHSGGAKGYDTEWDLIGNEFGVMNNKHYLLPIDGEVADPRLKAKGVKPVDASNDVGNVAIQGPATGEAQIAVTNAERAMGRIEQNHVTRNTKKIRNYAQVKNADGIFAIGSLIPKGADITIAKGQVTKKALVPQVNGGTSVAVQLGIMMNKPTYVFNQVANNNYHQGWYKWDNIQKDFVPIDTPILTKNFAGIGTSSNTTEQGKQAIRDVYEKTFGSKVEKPKQFLGIRTFKEELMVSIEDLTIEESIKEELRQQLNNAQTEPELGEVIKRICNL